MNCKTSYACTTSNLIQYLRACVPHCAIQVTPMMDRDLIILCNTQLGFIDFMVAPLVTGKTLVIIAVC